MQATHKKRWITALVALPLLLFFLYAGGVLLMALLCIVGALALGELFNIVFAKKPVPGKFVIYIFSVIMLCAALLSAFSAGLQALSLVLFVDFLIMAVWITVVFEKQPAAPETVIRQFCGLCYITIPLASALTLRQSSQGLTWLILLIFVVFAGDIAAYYLGTYFGRHKLCPAVSPNKTIEGALGGVATNLVTGSVIKGFFLPQVAWAPSLLLFVLLGICGQIGDLFESALKRQSAIKDSGSLLPGHGGILDRIDALLFALPAGLLYKLYLF